MTRGKYQLILSLIAVAVFVGPALGARGRISGSEWALWTEGGHSVIVASVHDVERVQGEGFQPYHATLKPRATLAGALDPSVNVALPVNFYVSSMTSSISVPPRENDLILAVVRIRHGEQEGVAQANWIVSETCTFMPNGSSVACIRGLDDPLVLETLKKVQAARANPQPDPYGARTRPGTRPATP
jgi:hypothetical protein